MDLDLSSELEALWVWQNWFLSVENITLFFQDLSELKMTDSISECDYLDMGGIVFLISVLL